MVVAATRRPLGAGQRTFPTPRVPRGAAASEQFVRALINAAAAGLRPHCSDAGTRSLWISEHEPERAQAVILCRGCPVLAECRAVATARNEKFGVWGSRDFTPAKKAAA